METANHVSTAEMIIIPMDCVPLGVYCQLCGENRERINKRIQRGIWRIGEEILEVDGTKERWVDLKKVASWARKNQTSNSLEA